MEVQQKRGRLSSMVRRDLIEQALEAVRSGLKLSQAAKRFGLSYSTLYLHYKKRVCPDKVRQATGRRRKYDQSLLFAAIQRCLSGEEKAVVAQETGIRLSTLATYCSLYATDNPNIKSLSVRIEKMKQLEKKGSEDRCQDSSANVTISDIEEDLPFPYVLSKGELVADYIEHLEDEITKETSFDFKLVDDKLCMTLRGLAIFFGDKERIVQRLYQQLCPQVKLFPDASVKTDPFRQRCLYDFFPVQKVLEHMRLLKLPYYYAEQLAGIFKYIKRYSPIIEKHLRTLPYKYKTF